MRIIVLFAFVFLLSACGKHDQKPHWEVEEAWRAEGFAQPESVVYDPLRQVFFVSNIAGDPDKMNGEGFISIVSTGGNIDSLKWVDGLNAPKGMALSGRDLYVADLNAIVKINVDDGTKVSYPVADAGLLNDVTVDADGNVYVSDTFTDTIYILRSGTDTVDVWLRDARLEAPNGLFARDDDIVVAAWGPLSGDGFATSQPGRIMVVDRDTMDIAPLFVPRFGNLDGIEPLAANHWLVSDWVAGKVFIVDADGNEHPLADPGKGSADLTYVDTMSMVLVPMMMDGSLIAYRLIETPGDGG